VKLTVTEIRKYSLSDKPYIVKLMEDFGDYLVNVDTMKRQRRMPEYGKWFTKRMLSLVNENNGVIYVAENNSQIVGFIAGMMTEQTEEELLECIPTKAGRVIELFVEESFRGTGIGTGLMEKVEEYFRKNGCDVSRVEVFEPNVKAHAFYRNLGYHDRSIDLMKKL
jgi:ribosomal protein S18 acetylase RimI-like enzyme